jgi:hypothetical protein
VEKVENLESVDGLSALDRWRTVWLAVVCRRMEIMEPFASGYDWSGAKATVTVTGNRG